MPDPVEEHPHFNTCTHRMDKMHLIKDAEGIALFGNDFGTQVHYSIRVADWYSCQSVGVETFDRWQKNPDQEMAYIQERVRELRSMHR